MEDTCFNVLSSRFFTHGNGVTALELDLEQTKLVPVMMKWPDMIWEIKILSLSLLETELKQSKHLEGESLNTSINVY